MKKIKLQVTLTIVLILFSCQKQPNFNKLKAFDLVLRKFEQINEFAINRLNGKYHKGYFEPDSLTDSFISDLEKLQISTSEYFELNNEMLLLGITTCIKSNEYSIYITGGSFARIYGYLINHSDRNFEDSSFIAIGRYDINVGEEIENKIYPIWTD